MKWNNFVNESFKGIFQKIKKLFLECCSSQKKFAENSSQDIETFWIKI